MKSETELLLEDPGFHSRLSEIIDTDEPFAWAARVGIPSASFSRMWKKGVVPKAPHLKTIREATGVSLDWLLTGEGPKWRREIAEPPSFSTPSTDNAADQPLPLLPELMKAVIKGMELAIRKDRMRLSPKQRGLAILALYDISYRRYMVRKAGGTPIDLDQDIDAVALSPDGSALLKLFDEDNRDPHDP